MWFEIKENEEIVKATMKDKKIVNVPNTFKNKNYTVAIIGSSIALVGIVVVLYGKKKKK